MRAWVWLLVAALLGIGAGAAVAFTVQDSASGTPPPTAPTSTTTTTLAVAALPKTPATPPPEGLYLAWTRGGLAAGLADGLTGQPLVDAATVVQRGPTELVRTIGSDGAMVDQPADGFVIPLDAMAFDPVTYPAVVPAAQKGAFDLLAEHEVLLGSTSAGLRRLGVGATLTFATGDTFTVAGIVDDEVIGGAEVAMTVAGAARVGATRPAYLLFTSTAERAALESMVREVAGPDRGVRLRAVGETPFLRNGDAVLPQVLIKERFGEFTYRRAGAGDDIEPDPAWVDEHIVTETVPVLGQVRCHRAVVPALRGALAEIERENLGHLIPAEDYLGCFVPRTTRYDEQLSRHSWGVALDLNYPKNPTGQRSVQDERLVEIFQAWGFTWGGEWLVPDPAHFEFVRPPDP
jgi:hypothetical protein